MIRSIQYRIKILNWLKWDNHLVCQTVGVSPHAHSIFVPTLTSSFSTSNFAFSSKPSSKTTTTVIDKPDWLQAFDKETCNNNLSLSPNPIEKIGPSEYTERSHTCGELTATNIGQKVTLFGWLAFKRLRGMFLVLRDTYGRTQAILPHDNLELMGEVEKAPLDSVVKIVGTVALRPEKQQKTDIVTGAIEIQVEELQILSKPDKMRISNREYGKVEEEIRMEYRYLDLRSEMLQKRLKFRANLIKRMRHFMNSNHFIDIETPTLLRGTPGGAREYPVATHHKGLFYSLAQSPQILKQLLMVGGMDRYYQIARCYRDEKSRPDRQPEFTQLDIELSFTTREQVMRLIENLLRYTLQLPSTEKFEVMSFETAMSKYSSDKPDTGGFIWIIDFPMFCQTENKSFEASHHPFTMPARTEEVYSDPLKAISLSYDLVYCGNEIGGGSIRIHDAKLQRYIYENILKLPISDIEYLLNALDSGCPPHGGFAIGLDRLVAILTGAKTIREVIAFPKTSDGKDLLSKAPSPLSENNKAYYHLK